MFFWKLPEKSFGIKEDRMFFSEYKSRLLRSIRTPEILIWTLLFPIALSSFFKTLEGINQLSDLPTIPVSVVAADGFTEDPVFMQLPKELEKEETSLFEWIDAKDQSEADTLLDNNQIKGYFLMENGIRLIVKSEGIEQTILKNFLDQYLQMHTVVGDILTENPEIPVGNLIEKLTNDEQYVTEVQKSLAPPSGSLSYFLALIGMLCLFGGFQGLDSVTLLQANLSACGIRRSISPSKKRTLLLADLLGGYTVHLFCTFVVFLYMLFVLRVDFGNRLGGCLFVGALGSFVGVSLGAMVSAVTKIPEMTKSGILVCVTLVFSFFAGLMVEGVQYLVQKNLPVLSWINPVARISDALYCLYYYEDYKRFFLNILVLIAAAVLFNIISIVFLRRQTYESV